MCEIHPRAAAKITRAHGGTQFVDRYAGVGADRAPTCLVVLAHAVPTQD